MLSRLPRWLTITLIALAVAIVVTGLVLLILWRPLVGWVATGVVIAAVGIIAAVTVPPLYKLYKFQKYFKAHESQLNMLPGLMQSGRVQEALVRFEGVMKHAPENAYVYYMRAFFLHSTNQFPQAMAAATKALSLVDKDPFLGMILQQTGGQFGQPGNVEDFKTQLQDLCRSLEPRLNQMRERREKAADKRKKKSR